MTIDDWLLNDPYLEDEADIMDEIENEYEELLEEQYGNANDNEQSQKNKRKKHRAARQQKRKVRMERSRQRGDHDRI